MLWKTFLFFVNCPGFFFFFARVYSAMVLGHRALLLLCVGTVLRHVTQFYLPAIFFIMRKCLFLSYSPPPELFFPTQAFTVTFAAQLSSAASWSVDAYNFDTAVDDWVSIGDMSGGE